MREIRPIRETEAEAFLQHLCDVFKLDFNRAYDPFFQEPFFDLRRKWAIFDGPQIVCGLQTVPLEFGWGRAVGIAGVATRESNRGEGLASRLLERVLRESERAGEGSALLFAQRTDLYARAGFEPLDRVIRAPLPAVTGEYVDALADTGRVRDLYNAWAEGSPDRLRRDDARWKYWNWHFRIAQPVGDGYAVIEPSLLREGLFHRSLGSLPLPNGTEFVGLTSVADALGLTFSTATVELVLMGYRVPGVPQMFMTDQF
ncbi:MAG: GNAT family N-acetyltransferase [Fimbriimonadaceae bacterium]|nr:GNAT family N-acetyltransferase [Fimbriimonadaceae bacterium]